MISSSWATCRRARSTSGPAAPYRARTPFAMAVLRAVEVAVHLHGDGGAAEDAAQPVEDRSRGVAIARAHRGGQGPARAAGEAHETVRRGFEVLEADGGLALGRAELGARDQPAEVLPALAILDQHGQPRAAGECQLAADERADARVDRGAIEARRC